MQTLKVFIFVEGESGKDELRIDGNLDTLRAFLSGVGNFDAHAAPMFSSPLTATIPQDAASRIPTKDKSKLIQAA